MTTDQWLEQIANDNPLLALYLRDLEFTQEAWDGLEPEERAQSVEEAREYYLMTHTFTVPHEVLLKLMSPLAEGHEPPQE